MVGIARGTVICFCLFTEGGCPPPLRAPMKSARGPPRLFVVPFVLQVCTAVYILVYSTQPMLIRVIYIYIYIYKYYIYGHVGLYMVIYCYIWLYGYTQLYIAIHCYSYGYIWLNMALFPKQPLL